MSPDDASGKFQPLGDETFTFACHPGVPCFTECCQKLDLTLTPYDILRLSRNLGLSTGDLIETYTRLDLERPRDFPRRKLAMGPDGRCPFVSEAGCRVYPDRPGACRLYPLGRGSATGGPGGAAREMFFLVKEDHCRGFETGPAWTARSWMADQELDVFQRHNDQWMEIVTRHDLKAAPVSDEEFTRKIQMFNLVSYNLDRFREFLFKTRFLDSFELDPAEIDAAREGDEALLELGMKWLRFALFGDPTLKPKRA
jgi:Fe-S-cluster containining protein